MACKIYVLDLNDDCLGRIFDFLDLHDCSQVTKVCKRFQQIVNEFCKHKVWIKRANDVHERNSVEWMERHIGKRVEHLDFREISEEEYKRLVSETYEYCFPNVKYLKLHTIIQKYTTSLLAKLFPNLAKLYIEGQGLIKTEDMDKLNSLTEVIIRPEMENDPDYKTFRYEDYKHTREGRRNTSFCGTAYYNSRPRNPIEKCLGLLSCIPNLSKISCIANDSSKLSECMSDAVLTFQHQIISLRAEVRDCMQCMDYFRLLRKLRVLYLQEHHKTAERCAFVDQYWYCGDDEFFLYFYIKKLANLEILGVPYEWIEQKMQLAALVKILKNQTDRVKPLELRALVHDRNNVPNMDIVDKGLPGVLNIRFEEFPKCTEKFELPYYEGFELICKPHATLTYKDYI